MGNSESREVSVESWQEGLVAGPGGSGRVAHRGQFKLDLKDFTDRVPGLGDGLIIGRVCKGESCQIQGLFVPSIC